ncbi:hypothetical protein GGF46_001029 [Coemansia sp. RSA 552]|nr:hypothetical protein GGF46_001029 [Coemansia sp. RSA 552]
MAGLVVSTRRTEENVDQLSSQTATSPYQYAGHKDTADLVQEKLLGASCTDVDTDTNDAQPSQYARGDSRKRSGSVVGATNGDVHLASSSKTNGVNGSLAQWKARQRLSYRESQVLANSRLYNSTYGQEPTRSHHEKAMRRSVHRLVSATTRFDRVSNGALALLADITRLYLTRLGEACRARADLAARSEPNLYDVLESGTVDMGVDWDSLHDWVDDWRDEVGETVPSAAAKGQRKQPGAAAGVDCGSGHGLWSGPAGLDDVDLEAIVNGPGLEDLILDDSAGAIPPHLPALVSISEHNGEAENGGSDALHAVATNAGMLSTPPPSEPREEDKTGAEADVRKASDAGANYPGSPMSPGSDSEEGPESIAAQLLHMASTSLSALNPTVASDKALHGFFRLSSKPDSAYSPDDVLPDFDVPTTGLIPTQEYIQEQLARTKKIVPGMPLFLVGGSAQRDVLGDTEEEWRQARTSMYPGIYDEAAKHAVEEMDNAPLPVRQRRESNASEKEFQAIQEANKEKSSAVEQTDVTEMDINLDEDVLNLDMDMDLDLDLDMDLDLDILNHLPAIQADAGDTKAEKLSLLGPERPVQRGPLAPTLVAREPEEKDPMPEPLPEPEPEPEFIDLPISSGLRGSGKPHWCNEWFSSAMSKRLSKITADDITPCDSLFLSSPSAGQRFVIDEVARAFVDSEGGGHLHETTPLDGFGPPASNTYHVPSASGSALRWVLHHRMQTQGPNPIGSLYTGRSSLAGGIAGNGISQYANRMCSLIKGSAEEEAELVVKGAIRAANDRDGSQWANRKINPVQRELMEQLIAGAEKRIPWAQDRLDIHVVESQLVGREPQVAATRPPPSLLMAGSMQAGPETPSDVPETPAPEASVAATDAVPAAAAAEPEEPLVEAGGPPSIPEGSPRPASVPGENSSRLEPDSGRCQSSQL